MPSASSSKPRCSRQVVEPRVAADEKPPVLERLDVKIGLPERHGVADDFFDDIGERDDSFGAAEFIDHDREPLRMGEKAAEQIVRAHRFRHERRRAQVLGIVIVGIEQERFDVENAERFGPASRRRPARGDAASLAICAIASSFVRSSGSANVSTRGVMQSFAVLSPSLMISWIISPSASCSVPSSSLISTSVSSSSSLIPLRCRDCARA